MGLARLLVGGCLAGAGCRERRWQQRVVAVRPSCRCPVRGGRACLSVGCVGGGWGLRQGKERVCFSGDR